MDNKEEEVPRAFIDWGLLHESLNSILSPGISSCLLMKLDGQLLSIAGNIKSQEKVISALVANIWKQYETHAENTLLNNENNTNNVHNTSISNNNTNSTNNNNTNNTKLEEDYELSPHCPLQLMLMESESGCVYVTKISRFLLGISADNTVNPGQIKLKVNLLRQHLQPLNRVYAS